MVTFGQLTVIEVGPALAVPSFPVVTLALLVTVPHDAKVVGEVRCTWALALGASVPKLQVRTPVVIEHPAVEPAASIDQLRPALVGRVSVTVTFVADPAPLLVAVIR